MVAWFKVSLGDPVSLKVLYSEQIADNPSKAIRVLEPLRQLANAGLVNVTALESLGDSDRVAGFDAIFLHMVDLNLQTESWLLPLLSTALSEGVALICDTDDPYFFAADGCAFDDKIAPHLELMRRLCGSAHLLTVTTAPLKQELSSMARAVAVIPNMIDLDNAPHRSRGEQRVRIGWCGGPTHADDLAMFLPAVAELQRRHPVDFVVFGMFDRNFDQTVMRARKVPAAQRARDPSLAAFGRMADALEGIDFKHFPSVAYPEFPRALAELNFDIGVCPLLDTRFNRCRSAVKFYQYAAAGTVTVASNVASYQHECSLLADNTRDSWVSVLEPLVMSEQLRGEALATQTAYVRNHRSWQAGLPLYHQLFTRVCAAVQQGRRT